MEKPQYVTTIPAGSKITTFDGRLVVASPEEPPYFLEIDVTTDPMTVRKQPVDLDRRLPAPMHPFLRFGR